MAKGKERAIERDSISLCSTGQFGESHENNFDLLRLFAAFNVLFQHAAHLHVAWPAPIVKLVVYTSGVPVFFIISGFLIAGSFFRNQGRIGPYLVNRALRIYPALWINLAVILAMLVTFAVLPVGLLVTRDFAEYWAVMMATGSHTVANWLLGPFPFAWNDRLPFLPTGALWTIVLELGFYLIVPAIFLPPIRRRPVVALIVAVAVVAWSYHVAIETRADTVARFASPIVYFWMFGIGVVAAIAWPVIAPVLRGKFLVWAALYVLVIIATGDNRGILLFHPTPLSTALMLLLAACVLSAAFTWTNLSSAMLGRNDISYGIYLHHMPIVMLLRAGGYNGFAGAAILIVTTVAAALASWFLVERPMLALKPKPRARCGPGPGSCR